MGRVRVQIKKIENKTYRHITFAKRKNGLLKKAYEISTLCVVEVALIIFSPAGKLILFYGKKRLEEILLNYVDLPQHQRGRLHDQEMVRRMIAQMSLEAELSQHIPSNNRNDNNNSSDSDRDKTMSFDRQLEEIEKEICMRSAELEDVEKQLQYFIKSPSCIKSASEAEFLEGILEETLKLVSIHKQNLEAKNDIQFSISEERPIHPQSAGASRLIMGGSNYCMGNWPQQYEHDTRVLTANHFSNSAHFQSLRNESSQPLAEVLPSSLPNLCGTAYQNPTGIVASSSTSRAESDSYSCQLPYDKLLNNAHFSGGMNNIQQGKASSDNEQNKTDDAAQYRDCGLPFPY